MRRKKEILTKRTFSLIEISLSLSILSVLASVLGWQTRDFYKVHQFQEEVKRIVIDIRQMQALALSHQTEFTLEITRDAQKRWSYTCSTDEPLPHFARKESTLLTEVSSIVEKKGSPPPSKLSIYSNGRIEPPITLVLEGKKGKYELDLTLSPQIKLKESHEAHM